MARREDVARVLREHDAGLEAGAPCGRVLSSGVRLCSGLGGLVFPGAEVKFLLDASAETRARRRFDEMRRNGQSVTYEQVLANLIERDQTDEKQWAPLLHDPSVVKIDTTGLSIEQVVDRLYEEVKRALAERNRIDGGSSKP